MQFTVYGYMRLGFDKCGCAYFKMKRRCFMKLTDLHVDCVAMPNAPVSLPLALLYAPSTYIPPGQLALM